MKRTLDRPKEINRDKNGKALCLLCSAPVAKYRRKYCSQTCADEFDARVRPSAMRWLIHRRDRGVCAICCADMDKLERVLCRLDDWWNSGRPNRLMIQVQMGFGWGHHLWEADHIVPIVEGGSLGSDNVRTLCLPCHKAETRALAARRATLRRDQSRALLLEMDSSI